MGVHRTCGCVSEIDRHLWFFVRLLTGTTTWPRATRGCTTTRTPRRYRVVVVVVAVTRCTVQQAVQSKPQWRRIQFRLAPSPHVRCVTPPWGVRVVRLAIPESPLDITPHAMVDLPPAPFARYGEMQPFKDVQGISNHAVLDLGLGLGSGAPGEVLYSTAAPGEVCVASRSLSPQCGPIRFRPPIRKCTPVGRTCRWAGKI